MRSRLLRHSWRHSWRNSWPAVICIAIVGGLAIGIGTQVLQGVLPGSWGVLANSGVAWALGAFAIGMLMPSDPAAGVGGALAMALAATSYYWAVGWFEDSGSNGTGALVWTLAGLVAGPFFGVAGRWALRKPALRWLAIAPVAGILAGEGAHLVWFVGVDNLWPAGLAELVLAAIVLACCLARDRRRMLVLAVFAGACACFFVAEKIIERGFA
jgi:hypothetical protein